MTFAIDATRRLARTSCLVMTASLVAFMVSSAAQGDEPSYDDDLVESTDPVAPDETVEDVREAEREEPEPRTLVDFSDMVEQLVEEDPNVDPDGDPFTESLTSLLREGDLLQRQEELGRGMRLMERQARFVESAHNILNQLGPDARIEVAPGEFITFEETPVWYQAEITRLNMEREIIETRMQNERISFDHQRETPDYANRVAQEARERIPPIVQERREEIVEEAQADALDVVRQARAQSAQEMQQAETQAESIIQGARIEANDMVRVAQEGARERRNEMSQRRLELEAELQRLQ